MNALRAYRYGIIIAVVCIVLGQPDGRGMYVYYTPTHWHR